MAVQGGPGFAGGYAPQPKVRFEVLGESWRIVQTNLGTWIGATVITLVCVVVLNVLLGAILGRSTPGNAIGAIGGWIISFFFQCGMARMAVRQVRGERVEIGDLFSVTDVIGNVAIGAILYSLLTGVGLILCIVPGLILLGLLIPFAFLISDRRMDAAGALNASLNTMKTDLLMATVFVFVCGIILLLTGLFTCGLGLLVTVPIVYVAEAIIYREFFPDSGDYAVNQEQPPYAVPPTTGPSEPPVQP